MPEFEQNFLSAWRLQSGSDLPERDSENDSQARTDACAGRANIEQSSAIVSSSEATSYEPGLPPDDLQPLSGGLQTKVNVVLPKAPGLLFVCAESEHLDIPVLSDNLVDSELFQQLRMFYRYLKIKRGLVELIIPRKLVQIDYVKVSFALSVAMCCLSSAKLTRAHERQLKSRELLTVGVVSCISTTLKLSVRHRCSSKESRSCKVLLLLKVLNS